MVEVDLGCVYPVAIAIVSSIGITNNENFFISLSFFYIFYCPELSVTGFNRNE